ncbi:DUF4349 domain-containing protein [Actinomadura sp. 9N407]|uniref:DUF4349 domain-containing protein n=1 Tax=Actinomadura sp. 9N407 TaxID=3375154 RepID=UPI0037B42AB6
MTVRHAPGVLVALLLAGTLAACGGGGGSDSTQAGQPASARDGGSTRNPAGDRDPTAAGGANQNREGGQGTGQAPGKQPGQVTVPTGRSVVHTAELRVSAPDVDQAATKAKQMATGAGGYVENESSTTSPASARLSLKIPADRYTSVLDQLTRQLGEKLSLRQEADDVTEEVADVGSRVRSAEATLASFRKLLDKADTVGEVINVEEQIAERQANLESLQARQKALQESTSYATVSLTLQTPAKAAKEAEEDPGGFIGGLENGWNAFTGFISGLALVVGWLLPFLVLAAVIGIPAYLYWRRHQRSQGPSPSSAPAPTPAPAPAPESVPASASESGDAPKPPQ